MKITIDLKSALCGLIVGVVVMLVTGAGMSSGQVGKYTIATGAMNEKGFAIMIDTQTGQAWGYMCGTSESMVQTGYMPSVDFWKAK